VCSALGLYSEGPLLMPRLRNWLPWLRFFMFFLSLQVLARTLLQIRAQELSFISFFLDSSWDKTVPSHCDLKRFCFTVWVKRTCRMVTGTGKPKCFNSFYHCWFLYQNSHMYQLGIEPDTLWYIAHYTSCHSVQYSFQLLKGLFSRKIKVN